MARRIATAEVLVASDVRQAEAGLNGLTETFRAIGSQAELAAERAEVAMFGASRKMADGFEAVEAAVRDVVNDMRLVDEQGKLMARSFQRARMDAVALSQTDMDAGAREMLRVLKEATGAMGVLDGTAEKLAHAFRDVGREIDRALNGGTEGLRRDIEQVIDSLEEMGGEFRDVARIGRQTFDDLTGNAEFDVIEVDRALERLLGQLRRVQAVGDGAMDSLEAEARDAAGAINRVGDEARRAGRQLDRMDRRARGLTTRVHGLTAVLGAAGLGYAMTRATQFGLDMTIQLEKSEAMFLGLTGSVEGAADMLERMVVFARETPYNLAQVSQSAAQLLAVGDGFGVTTTNVEEYLRTFGDALTITGGSEDQFLRIVRVLGQMSSTGKVLGQDMNQLAQNLPGFNVWETLADGAGTSIKELRRLQDIGKLDELLSGDEAVRILVEGMKGIPGAAGAMERRMDTLGGALEKFKETAQLAASEGLEPFSETAQDLLSDPVMLNSVEGMADAFGSLLSSGLEAVAPELDDLATAITNFLGHLESWGPVLGHVVDILGDLLNVIGPVVGAIGSITGAVLGFGDGLGKAALAAAGFRIAFTAALGPVGWAISGITAISAAVDLFGGANEDAADMARQLAAAQYEVNDAVSAGEEEIYSAAQQYAIDTAEKLTEYYPRLAEAMGEYGVSVRELHVGLENLKSGAGAVAPELREMIAAIEETDSLNTFEFLEDDPRDRLPTQMYSRVIRDLLDYESALEKSNQDIIESEEKRVAAMEIAAIDEEAAIEEREEAHRQNVLALEEYHLSRMELEREGVNTVVALTEEEIAARELAAEQAQARSDQVRDLLRDQVAEYESWKQGIDDSTDGAVLSLSEVAESSENSLARMTEALRESTTAQREWKDDIATIGVALHDEFGVSEDAAYEFMAALGEMGIDSSSAVSEMVDSIGSGGEDLLGFFEAWQEQAAEAETSLVDSFNNSAEATPTLVQKLADGTATVDEVLAVLPEAIEAAGLDMEAEAGTIDLSDDFGEIGDEAVAGLINALNAGNLGVRDAAYGIAVSAITGARSALRVQSPSRVMYEIGEYTVEGLVDGIQSMDDEAYAVAVQTASLLSGGIEHHFRDADDPRREAEQFASEIAETIIDELIAEQEAVADAAQALAESAADRLADAWDAVRDRFRNRDIREAVADARSELEEAQAELASAKTLAFTEGSRSRLIAERRVREARQRLAAAEDADKKADKLAEQTLTNFERNAEDAISALEDRQEVERASIEQRIEEATRNLDPAARAAAEAELAAAAERHEAEMLAIDRRQEDELAALQDRLDAENELRELAINSKEEELQAFEAALEDLVESISDAVADIPKLRSDVTDAERGLQDAYLDKFEKMLEDGNFKGAAAYGRQAGLTDREVSDIIKASRASLAAEAGAAASEAGMAQLIKALTSGGLFTAGSDGLIRAASGNSLASALISQVAGGVAVPPPSGLDGGVRPDRVTAAERGPLLTIDQAVFQDATDADLVAQRIHAALSGAVRS